MTKEKQKQKKKAQNLDEQVSEKYIRKTVKSGKKTRKYRNHKNVYNN